MASTKATWEVVALPQLTDDPTVAFTPVAAIGTTNLPPMPQELLQAQVVLLHEDLRDYQELALVKSGRKVTGVGTIAHATVALQSFALHEAAALTLAGLFQTNQSRSGVEFALTPLGMECMRDRVLSTAMQNFTEGAMRSALDERIRDTRGTLAGGIAEALGLRQLDALEADLLDTYFSLSSSMQCDAAVAPLIVRARQLCRWMALLAMVRLAGEHVFRPNAGLLVRLKLDPAVPNAVITAQASALSSDKGIRPMPLNGFSLGDASLGHAIACCKKTVLSDADARSLGDIFETNIKSYVQECVNPEDYVVRDGLKAAGKDKGINYDCDLILYEPKRQKIFFVQAKWKLNNRTANLDDELNLWRGEKSLLTKGLTQLNGLRERLREKSVFAQVKNRLKDFRLTDQQILDNSHFILVHTLPYFNCYMNEGIVIYEWNFLRNILLRGAIQRTEAPIVDCEKLRQVTTVFHKETLPLENPERALNYFFQTIRVDLNASGQLMETRMQARYEFEVELRVGWRRQLLGRKSMKIVRPYL